MTESTGRRVRTPLPMTWFSNHDLEVLYVAAAPVGHSLPERAAQQLHCQNQTHSSWQTFFDIQADNTQWLQQLDEFIQLPEATLAASPPGVATRKQAYSDCAAGLLDLSIAMALLAHMCPEQNSGPPCDPLTQGGRMEPPVAQKH